MSENKTQANEKASPFLKVAEVARILRVNPTTVRGWIVNGLLDATPLPHRGKRQEYRITPEALDRAIRKAGQTSGTLSLVKTLDASNMVGDEQHHTHQDPQGQRNPYREEQMYIQVAI